MENKLYRIDYNECEINEFFFTPDSDYIWCKDDESEFYNDKRVIWY